MATPKRVLYHNGNEQVPSELFVLSANVDGTLNLTRDGETPIVTKCVLSDVAKVGGCTPFPGGDAEEEEPAGDDELTPAQKKAAAKKAAADRAAAEADKT